MCEINLRFRVSVALQLAQDFRSDPEGGAKIWTTFRRAERPVADSAQWDWPALGLGARGAIVDRALHAAT